MAKRRGFFAELNYQAQQAEKQRQQQASAAYRAQAAAQRDAERAQKAEERAMAAYHRAEATQKKDAEKEATSLRIEAGEAEAESRNLELENTYAEIDSMLAWTLQFDDWVDLETLRVGEVRHPPFVAHGLDQPTPALPELEYPPQPVLKEPPPPKGLGAMVGGKKRHEEAVARANSEHQTALAAWHTEATRMYEAYGQRATEWEASEQKRLSDLETAQAAYAQECAQREVEAAEGNLRLDQLINDLAFDVPQAIQDYVGIVLSNSVYPTAFPVDYDYSFDLGSRELALVVDVPEPSAVPSAKQYRYVKAKDEVTSTELSAKAQKDRYASAVWQVAVRTLHEIFEADRSGKIHSIALTVQSHHIDPGTGQPASVPLVVVGADRDTFASFDLANVVPDATLKHLGASISKSPFELVPADTSRGVRGRST